MIIPEEIFSKWEPLMSKGDFSKIAEKANCHAATISRAINTKECSDETFIAISAFYAEKLEMLKKAEQIAG